MKQKKNKKQNTSKIRICGKFIDETPIQITEIRLQSLMKKTYEKAVMTAENKANYHISAWWSTTLALLLSWLPLVIEANKEAGKLIYIVILSLINFFIFIIAIILTILQKKKEIS